MDKIKKLLRAVGQFFKGSVNIIKLSAWMFCIQTLMSLFSIVLVNPENDSKNWITLLSFVMLALNFIIIYIISKTSAYSDFQIYKNNRIRLNRGEDVPRFKIMRQYRPYNGYISGIVSCLISIILIISGIITSPITADTNTAGKIAMLLNFIYAVPVLNIGGISSLYVIIYGIALTIISAGLGYYIEGQKLLIRYNELQKRIK